MVSLSCKVKNLTIYQSSGKTNIPDDHDTYNFHEPSKTYPIKMEPKIGKTDCNVMIGRCLNNLMALHKHHLLCLQHHHTLETEPFTYYWILLPTYPYYWLLYVDQNLPSYTRRSQIGFYKTEYARIITTSGLIIRISSGLVSVMWGKLMELEAYGPKYWLILRWRNVVLIHKAFANFFLTSEAGFSCLLAALPENKATWGKFTDKIF